MKNLIHLLLDRDGDICTMNIENKLIIGRVLKYNKSN